MYLSKTIPNLDKHLSFRRYQAGFKAALNLMRLDATVVDEAWSKTPVCKRPASSEEVAEGLVLTPPLVVGPQSETCFQINYCFVYGVKWL